MRISPLPQPGRERAVFYRCHPTSLGCGLSLALLFCALPALPVKSAEPSLFPAGALALDDFDVYGERFEPAGAYDPISPDPINEFGPRSLDRGDLASNRDRPSLLPPHSRSHNLDWIESGRRSGARSFYASPVYDDVAEYQVYGRQQHHGRTSRFGNYNAYASPTGFGHGGFQSHFTGAASGAHDGRAPNFESGPLTAHFTGHSSAEWIDRLPSSVTTPEGTPATGEGLFIISGGIQTAATIQVTERGSLNLNLGLGVDYYPDGRAGNDGREDSYVEVQVLPNSYTSYEFEIGDAQFSIYDRFARFRNRAHSYYSLDPLDYADYQEHALGGTVRLPLNDRITADGGYEFGQLDSLGVGGELLDRATHNVFGGLSYSPDGAWELGVQASASTFDYSFAGRPDGSSGTFGVFGKLPLSEYTRLSATAGVHSFEFDPVDSFADSESLDSEYWSLSVENDLNDRLTHSVTIGSGASIGVSSNYVETTHAGYQARWRMFDSTVVTGGANFYRNAESGGLLAEEIDTLHYHFGVRQELTRHTSVGANFTQSQNVSDLAERDYDQQRLQLFCDIELNEKLDLHLSYQRWNVSTQSESNSFAQNSATIGLTYSF